MRLLTGAARSGSDTGVEVAAETSDGKSGAAPTVRMGIIGCADIARRKTIPAMCADGGTTVVAIASRTADRAESFTRQFGGESIVGYAELVDRDDIDAVYIPLPGRMHAEWIERCLTAGKHVLVEKPMTDDLATTERLVALAQDRGLVLLENYMFLHHSQHRRVQQLLDGEAIGTVRAFQSVFTIPPKPAGDIRYDPAVGGGAFLDFGGYPVRAASHFLGADLDVVGASFTLDRHHGVVVSGSVLLVRPDGVTAQLGFGMEHAYRNFYQFSGSTGVLELHRAFTPPDTHTPVVRIDRQDHSEQLSLATDRQFVNVISTFVAAVRSEADLTAATAGTLTQARLIERINDRADVLRR